MTRGNICGGGVRGTQQIIMTPEVDVTLDGGVGGVSLIAREVRVTRVSVVVGTIVKLVLTTLTVKQV